MTHNAEQEAAIHAARKCADAVSELLDFAHHGEASITFAFDDEMTCENIAAGLRIALQIDLARELNRQPEGTRVQRQRQLIASIESFLELEPEA